MNTRIALKTLALMVGLASVLFAAEVSQTEYRAPKTEAPRAEVTTRVTAQATVQKIDSKTRMITLKNEAGETFQIKAGPEVQRFAEIKKGDVVMVEYLESQALYVEKAEKGAVPTHQAGSDAVRLEGQEPGAVAADAERISAEVVKVDYKKRMITLKAADGTITTTHVPDSVRRLDEVKKGDHVVAERTIAMAIAVRKP